MGQTQNQGEKVPLLKEKNVLVNQMKTSTLGNLQRRANWNTAELKWKHRNVMKLMKKREIRA